MNKQKEASQAGEPLKGYEQPLTFEKVWAMFQETDKQFKETGLQFKETDRRFKETDRQFKETDRRLQKLDALFTSQWGKLIESLVEGDLVRLLNERGVPVHTTVQRMKGDYQGHFFEFDIVAENACEVVVVEVKTTLRPDDVKVFLDKLSHFKTWKPVYARSRVLGAMAFLTADAGSELMAQNQGLLVIRATGKSAHIINQPGFVPREF